MNDTEINEMKRLNLLRIMSEKSLRPSDLAQLLKTDASYVTMILKRESKEGENKSRRNIGKKMIEKLCAALSVSSEEFFKPVETGDEKESLNSSFSEIPAHKARLSGGPGLEPGLDAGEEETKIAFRRDWLSKKCPINKCVVMHVEGDSMEPVISDGDIVLVDRTQTDPANIISGKVYAFADDYMESCSVLKVKRLQKKGAELWAHSDAWNYVMKASQYEPYQITDMERFRLIGRVIWAGKEL